jgi:hypothetical protein
MAASAPDHAIHSRPITSLRSFPVLLLHRIQTLPGAHRYRWGPYDVDCSSSLFLPAAVGIRHAPLGRGGRSRTDWQSDVLCNSRSIPECRSNGARGASTRIGRRRVHLTAAVGGSTAAAAAPLSEEQPSGIAKPRTLFVVVGAVGGAATLKQLFLQGAAHALYPPS